jgi:hypothetical protein
MGFSSLLRRLQNDMLLRLNEPGPILQSTFIIHNKQLDSIQYYVLKYKNLDYFEAI